MRSLSVLWSAASERRPYTQTRGAAGRESGFMLHRRTLNTLFYSEWAQQIVSQADSIILNAPRGYAGQYRGTADDSVCVLGAVLRQEHCLG